MVFRKKRVWHCLPGQEPTELDKKVMYWENKGKEVPSRDLIKTPEQIEGIRRSGVVNTRFVMIIAHRMVQFRLALIMRAFLRACAQVSTRLCATAFLRKRIFLRRATS